MNENELPHGEQNKTTTADVLNFSDYLAALYVRLLTNSEANGSSISGMVGKRGGAHTSRDKGTSDFELRSKPKS